MLVDRRVPLLRATLHLITASCVCCPLYSLLFTAICDHLQVRDDQRSGMCLQHGLQIWCTVSPVPRSLSSLDDRILRVAGRANCDCVNMLNKQESHSLRGPRGTAL